MALLSGGLIAMGIADGGFTYLSTAGTYQTGSIIDVGWVSAFLLCAVAAVSDFSGEEASGSQSKVTRMGLYLPLVPLSLGMGVVVVQAWHSNLDHTLVLTGGLLMSLVVARQMLVLTENTRLVATVQQREEQLRHQAFHDPLTGLANRLLFRDRLEHAAALRQRDGSVLTVLFLDLDDFKLVNDKLGHAAGDALLVGVAERLRACLRQGDTVARLGGDEFAVLLEDDGPGFRTIWPRGSSTRWRSSSSSGPTASRSAPAWASRPSPRTGLPVWSRTACCTVRTWPCMPRRATPRARTSCTTTACR